MADYQALKSAATTLCADFAAGEDAPSLISHFSTHESTIAIEHGLPCLAPFLGHEFKGTSEVKQYFELLSEQLLFRNMEFDEYVVDTQQLKVSVKGKARFIWISTGDAWNETFTYTLDFVKEGGDALKIRRYQVWADTGAGELCRQRKSSLDVCVLTLVACGRGIRIAYLARNGKLKECLASAQKGLR